MTTTWIISVLQQCLELSQQGVRIRNVVVHTGQRSGHPVRQAIHHDSYLRDTLWKGTTPPAPS